MQLNDLDGDTRARIRRELHDILNANNSYLSTLLNMDHGSFGIRTSVWQELSRSYFRDAEPTLDMVIADRVLCCIGDDNCFEWYEVFDVLEIICENIGVGTPQSTETLQEPRVEFVSRFNKVFHECRVGYRFEVASFHIVPVTSDVALESFVGVHELASTERARVWEAVLEGLADLTHLSEDKGGCDAGSTIAAALNFFEGLMKDLTGNGNASFGALRVELFASSDKRLSEVAAKLWNFSCDINGGRHGQGFEGKSSATDADAIFVVTVISALSEYLLKIHSQDELNEDDSSEDSIMGNM